MTPDRSAVGLVSIAGLVGVAGLAAFGVISRQSLDYVFLCVVALTLFGLCRKWLRSPFLAAAIGVAVAVALAAIQLRLPSLHYMPYLVIAPANLLMAFVFARGLLPNRQPVLLGIIREIGKGPTDDPAFQRFVAAQCALWSVLTFATACLAALAMVSELVWPWVPGTLSAVIAIQVIWFVASHYYAARRYGRTETWWNTLQAMVRPDIWSRSSV